MITNGTLTIYRKDEEYAREVIDGIMWQGTHSMTATEKGLVVNDMADVFIPISNKQPRKGDVIVFGNCPFEFTDEERLKDLRRQYEARTIQSVKERNYGSMRMQHYEVIAV